MKNILIAMLLTMGFIGKSRAQKSLIYGKTAVGLPYSYAYLFDPETKSLLTTPIADHEFRFELSKADQAKILVLSFNRDYYKTYQEVKESYDYRSPSSTRMIAADDTVEIILEKQAKYAIVKGGAYNKDLDDMYRVIKSRKFDTFFDEHPDSPVALVFLETLAGYAAGQSSYFTMQQLKQCFEKLSDDLKNSEKGKKIFESIVK